jgi:hypothetical protein
MYKSFTMTISYPSETSCNPLIPLVGAERLELPTFAV